MRRHNVLLDIACGTEARDYNYSREVFSHKLQVSVQKKKKKKDEASSHRAFYENHSHS